MKINFNVTQEEAKLLVTSLQYAISQTSKVNVKKKLTKIINEINQDFWLDSSIFNFVHNLLDPYTNSSIHKNSHLVNQLSLDVQWINQFLHVGCNKIVIHLLKLSHSNKKPTLIFANSAKKCTKVQDIVDLIKNTYENAK